MELSIYLSDVSYQITCNKRVNMNFNNLFCRYLIAKYCCSYLDTCPVVYYIDTYFSSYFFLLQIEQESN